MTDPGVRRPRRWRLLAALTAGLAGAWSGCTDPGADAAAVHRQQVVPVHAAAAVQKDVAVRLRAIGTVEAYATVSVKSRVDGQVAQVHFREGQSVHRDDLLFTIDPRWFEAALRQAEANLARDRAQAENAEVEAQRLRRLLDQRIVSQDEYDEAKTRAAALRATVKADEAAVENARLEVLYCHIRSPIDGRVGQILVDLGNVVKSDETTLAVVNQIRPIYVNFSVPQRELPAIRQRSAEGELTVEVYVDDRREQPIAGRLSFINNEVDTDTGTVLLKGEFANQDEALWPGQFVDTAVTLAVRRDAVVVPSVAVQTGQQGQYVFTIGADGTAELRPVRVTEDLGDELVIAEGLRAGERVVTDGHLQLAPGVPVEVKNDAPANPNPTPASVG